MTIETIMADVDGTILKGRRYDDRLKEIIIRTRQAGINIGISTGRSKEETIPLYEELGLNGYLILEGGSVIYEPTRDETISLETSDKGAALIHMHEQSRIDLKTTLVIGNGENDISMFLLARGGAVANATKHLKNKAAYLSPHAYSLGVIDIINHYVNNQ